MDNLSKNHYTNQWQSQKGRARTENRDASGVHFGLKQTIAVIVDAAEKGPQDANYAITWVRQLIGIARSNETLSPDDLISAMRISHSTQRKSGFLKEIAAYAVLVLDKERQSSWALHCGDCRVGSLTNNGDVRWLTPVHTGANPFGEDFTIAHAQMHSRHYLTRKLRVKHFDEPELTTVDSSQVISWLLATDGYWVENFSNLTKKSEFEDDASILTLTPFTQDLIQVSDCQNFMHAKFP